MEIVHKKKKSGFLHHLKKQMSEFTVNYAAKRDEYRDSGIIEDFPEDSNLPTSSPGVVGLRNHGNTCFINAVVQCLNQTGSLVDCFTAERFRKDSKTTNGEVTQQFARILKAIWSCQYDPGMTLDFVNLVEELEPQFRTGSQQDAQEFLLWFLDRLHLDSVHPNKSTKQKKMKMFYENQEELKAAESLSIYSGQCSSFVQQLFQAQFRSSLTCPSCLEQSSTFDPYLSLSLPIPLKTRKRIYVTIVYTNRQISQVKVGLCLNTQSFISDLRYRLSIDTGIDITRILLTRITSSGFGKTYSDNEPISVLEEEELYCIELPQNRDKIILCWVNFERKGSCLTRFGKPRVLEVSPEVSYNELMTVLLKATTTKTEEPNFQDSMFRICVSSELLDDGFYLDPSVEYPLLSELVDEALSICEPSSGIPVHLKLTVEWDASIAEGFERLLGSDDEYVQEDPSVSSVKKLRVRNEAVKLEECLQLYTQAEKLGPDDSWYCPRCRTKREVVKKMTLWTCPDVLIVHLKRFKQSSRQGATTKLPVLVDFPIHGLDLSNHMTQRSSSSSQSDKDSGFWKSSTLLSRSSRRSSRSSANYQAARNVPEDSTYDLFAVCNHHGNDMASGHYTAYCRNLTDKQWYLFDDSRVTRLIDEQGVISSSAYILFYKRRTSQTTAPESSLGSIHKDLRLQDGGHFSGFKRSSFRYSTLQSTLRRSTRKGSLWSLNQKKSSGVLV